MFLALSPQHQHDDRNFPAPHVMTFSSSEHRIAELVDELPRPLEILEAGCGRRWTLKVMEPYTLTGIDLDPDALKARLALEDDLDFAIVGDIRNADLLASQFDVIYCSFVLEHVEGAETVLDNFARWLRPGGLLVIKVPDRASLYGLATRVTPYWFHVWYYRIIRGMKAAGTLGHGPYPTNYDQVISRSAFAEYCRTRGLVLRETHLVDNYIRGNRLLGALGRLVGALSAGRIPWRWNDLTYVVGKPKGIG